VKLEKDKKLHSREHVLADDLSQTLGEPKRFAMYLGIAKLYEESDLRGLAKYVAQKKELPPINRGKYFMASLRGLQKKIPALAYNSTKTIRRQNEKNRT
jgi:hypothetical protein